MSNWSMIIPRKIRLRISEQYTRTSELSGRLDVVVLNKSNRFANYVLPEDRFRLAYENAEFLVWERLWK